MRRFFAQREWCALFVLAVRRIVARRPAPNRVRQVTGRDRQRSESLTYKSGMNLKPVQPQVFISPERGSPAAVRFIRNYFAFEVSSRASSSRTTLINSSATGPSTR